MNAAGTETKTVARSESAALYRRALARIPGGVNSPARAFGAVGGDPLFIDRAEGARLWDADGAEYLDFVLSWGAILLGHAQPDIVRAVEAAARNGTSFGAPCEAEIELAELVADRVPSIESVRFVNSGTEATMSAARLARGVTGRDVVLKFAGCYHGHGDSFLVQAGSGAVTLGLPDSPGVPAALAELTMTAPYNDLDGVRAAFERHGERIACVIVEPVVGNAGLIPPDRGFLQGLRDLTSQYESLLIFDEVMTGFRIASGGAQELYDVRPDLTTLGKVVGGGLPVGAYGGPRELMERVAPAGPVYQAGTLSGNPLAMAAGLAQLRAANDPGLYETLEHAGSRLVDAILDEARTLGVPACGTPIGGMWGVHFTEGPVRDFDDASQADPAFFRRYFRAALERGVYLPPSRFEASFVSLAHEDAIINATADRLRDALREAAR